MVLGGVPEAHRRVSPMPSFLAGLGIGVNSRTRQ
jgi:hypothetical protein